MGDTDDGKTTLGAEFNLLIEPWIPVLRRDGRTDRVGIRCALTEAGTIRQIAASNPMDRVALLRLLLAVLQWCKPTPTSGEIALLRADGCVGIPDKWLDAKLGTPEAANVAFALWPERGNGFLQTASRDKEATEPPTYLLHEFPVGTNIAHFRHARDDAAPICPACAALGLVRAPLFTTQGGSGKSPGINDKPPIYFFPTGVTLLDTLLLQWPFEVSAYDRPSWEGKPHREPTDPVGVLEGFTWLPRRVRLQASRTTGGPCAVCGLTEDGGAFVTRIVFEGDPGSKKDEKSGLVWRDPHVAYPEPKSPKTDGLLRAANSLGRVGSALGQWRRLLTGALASESVQARPPAALQSAAKRARAAEHVEVEACGFASDQMKYMECWSQSLKLPLGDARLDADRASLIESIAGAGAAVDGVRRALRSLRPDKKHEAADAAFAGGLAGLEDGLQKRCGPTALTESASRPTIPPSSDLARKSLTTAVASLTPGSTLRRLEARERARKALERAITQSRTPPAEPEDRTGEEPPRADAEPSARRRKRTAK